MQNAQGEKLGDVKDVVIEPANGNVTHIVVGVGGVIGVGEKLFAVPYDRIDMAQGRDHLVLRGGSTLAKGFDEGDWPAPGDPALQQRQRADASASQPIANGASR